MGLKKDILIGLGMLGIILLVVTSIIGLALIARKAIGLLLILFGLFLLLWFPDVMGIQEYQIESMSKKGIWIGIISFLLGLYFLIF